jgi:hypothetical protein
MAKLVALKPCYFDNKDLQADQEFEAEDKYADILIRVGAARLKDPEKPKAKRAYVRRDMTAD